MSDSTPLPALLPCPFCSGNPTLEDHRTIWAVRCKCGASMLGERAPEPECEMPPEYWKAFERSAVTAWNQRAAVADAVLRERERCARLCEQQAAEWDSDGVQTFKNYAGHCAAAIRATPAETTTEGKTE